MSKKTSHKGKSGMSSLKAVFDALTSRLDTVVQPSSKSGDFKGRLEQYQTGLSLKSTMNYEQDQLEQLDSSLSKNLEQKRQDIAQLKARLNRLSQDLVRLENGEPLPSRGMESVVLAQKIAKKETALHEIERAIKTLEKENEKLAAKVPAQGSSPAPKQSAESAKSKTGEAQKLQADTQKEMEQAQREASINIKKISEEIEKRANEINVLEMQLNSVEGRIELMTRAGKIPKKTFGDKKKEGSDAGEEEKPQHRSMIAVRKDRVPSPGSDHGGRTKLPSLTGAPRADEKPKMESPVRARPPSDQGKSGLPRPRYTPKKGEESAEQAMSRSGPKNEEQAKSNSGSSFKSPDSEKKKSGLPRPTKYTPKKEEAEEAEPVETKAPAPGLEDLDARFEFLLADDEEEEADEGFTVPGMIETVEEVQIDLLNATFDTDIRVTERKPMPNGFEMTFYHIVDRIPKFVE